MIVVGVDLSSKPGLACLRGDAKAAEVLQTASRKWQIQQGMYPFEWMDVADQIAVYVVDFIVAHAPDRIFIEETNGSRARFTQKVLEWCHFALLQRLRGAGLADRVVYIDTQAWRRELRLTLSKEDRRNNAAVKRALRAEDPHEAKRKSGVRGRRTSKHLAVDWANQRYGLALRQKDNDIADALCLASAGLALHPLDV